MALINEAALALAPLDDFGPLGGDDPWSIFLGLMPDQPTEVVALYPRTDPIRDGVREAAGLEVRVRGVRAEDTFNKLEALLEALSQQPLSGWLAWTDSNLALQGEEDQRRIIVSSDIAFLKLCDTVDVERWRRSNTSLSYEYVHVETLEGVPALVASDSASRELYRGALAQEEQVKVYLKAGSYEPSDYLVVNTDRGSIGIDSNIRRGVTCGRRVHVLSGTRRTLI